MRLQVIAFAALCFFVFILILGSCTIVPPGHRGIVVTLGKVDERVRGEGVAFHLPMVSSLVKMPVQQITRTGQTGVYSSDLQTVEVQFSVLYKIPESSVITLYRDYHGDPYENLILPRVQEALKQIMTSYRAEDLLKHREKAKFEAREKVAKDIGSIITVVDFVINNIDLTDQLEHAIEQKTVREQEALAKQFELEKVKKDAEMQIVSAQAEAQSVKIRGEALRDSKGVIELEIIKKWDGRAPQTVVTGQSGANILLPIK